MISYELKPKRPKYECLLHDNVRIKTLATIIEGPNRKPSADTLNYLLFGHCSLKFNLTYIQNYAFVGVAVLDGKLPSQNDGASRINIYSMYVFCMFVHVLCTHVARTTAAAAVKISSAETRRDASARTLIE